MDLDFRLFTFPSLINDYHVLLIVIKFVCTLLFLVGYVSTLRNNVRSRAWGAAIGCSYRVERCCIVKVLITPFTMELFKNLIMGFCTVCTGVFFLLVMILFNCFPDYISSSFCCYCCLMLLFLFVIMCVACVSSYF